MTTISVETPSAMPRNDSTAMTETNPPDRRARKYRQASIHSNGAKDRVRVGSGRTATSGSAALTLIPASSRDEVDGIIRRKHLPLAALAVLHLDFGFREALGPDDNLPGQANEIESREFGAWALVAIVVEHLTAGAFELLVKAGAGGVGRRIADLQIR